MTNGNVLFVIPNKGFQHVEYGVPKQILEDAGYSVVTASDAPTPATGKDESTTPVDITLEQVNVENYHGIFFIGGPGTLEHLDNKKSYRIIRESADAGLPFGAICIATRILAKSGALNGKHATGWDGDSQLESIYQENGAIYQRNDIVTDNNIITATGPHAAKEFGERIIAAMQDHKGWG